MTHATITALAIYPVKSLAGIELTTATLTPWGLRHDRRFMVVNANDRFVTQRQLPSLARVKTALTADHVILSADGAGDLTVPLEASSGETIQTRVWKDDCETLDCGEEAAEWLTSAASSKQPLRLVRMKPGYMRPQNRPQRFGAKNTTFFADAAPYLVTNQASLDALNSELLSRQLEAVPMNRFRPNIVIEGLPAFAEHQCSRLSGEHSTVRLCDPCERCVVTTIDQSSGVKDPAWQPFKTLRDINPMPGNPRAPAFGQNAVLESGDGHTLRLGERWVAESA